MSELVASIAENVTFVLEFIGIVIAMVVIAVIAEEPP